MEIITKLVDDTITIEYKLNQIEMEILQFVKEKGYICFRNSIGIKDKLDDSGQFNESDCDGLLDYQFLKYNDDSWHIEYNLIFLAKKVLSA